MQSKHCNYTAEELIVGAYDLHVHSAPSHIRRTVDDIDVLQQASAYHMGGVIIKCHYEPTGARAELVNRHFGKKDGTVSIGSITLNWPVGGLNPYAVESACRLGAKYIWMPTRDAYHSLAFGNMIGDFFRRPGIKVIDESGKLLPCVLEILEIAREKKVPVATGHISLEESIILCTEGVKMGNKMILTHPEWSRTTTPLEVQQDLARRGVWIEKVWLNIAEKDVTEQYLFHTIREIGAEHIFIGTDSGKDISDHEKTPLLRPVDAYLDLLTRLIHAGFSEDEVLLMSKSNPHYLIYNN